MMIIHHHGLTSPGLAKLPAELCITYPDGVWTLTSTKEWQHFRSVMQELDLQIAITSRNVDNQKEHSTKRSLESLLESIFTVRIFKGTETIFRMSEKAALKSYVEICLDSITTLEEYRAEQRWKNLEDSLPAKDEKDKGTVKI